MALAAFVLTLISSRRLLVQQTCRVSGPSLPHLSTTSCPSTRSWCLRDGDPEQRAVAARHCRLHAPTSQATIRCAATQASAQRNGQADGQQQQQQQQQQRAHLTTEVCTGTCRRAAGGRQRQGADG